MNVNLEKKIRIIAHKKKTTSAFWSMLQPGDILHLSTTVMWMPSGSKPSVTVTLESGRSISYTFTQVHNGLKLFEYEEIK